MVVFVGLLHPLMFEQGAEGWSYYLNSAAAAE